MPALKPSPDSQAIELLQSHSLTTLVQREIERMILAGNLASGDKLNEAEIAIRLGVSRGPVREAFRALEEAGLVRTEKNRGVFVRVIAIDEHLSAVPEPRIEPLRRRDQQALHAFAERAFVVGLDDEVDMRSLNAEMDDAEIRARQRRLQRAANRSIASPPAQSPDLRRDSHGDTNRLRV